MIFECKHCGKEFVRFRKYNYQFCSMSCVALFYHANLTEEEKVQRSLAFKAIWKDKTKAEKASQLSGLLKPRETDFQKGQTAWNMGLTKETDSRVAQYGKNSGKTRTGISLSKEHVEAVTKSITGLKRSDKAKKNYRLSKLGDKNPAWKGGISEIAYPEEWNAKLKELVRFRDNFQCQLCGCPESENERKLDIHHIDYDKKNCSPDNLISLCVSCHIKTRYSRSKWQRFFEEQISITMNSKITKLKSVKRLSDKPKLVQKLRQFNELK